MSNRSTRLRALAFLLLSLAIGAVLLVAMTWFVIGSAPRSTAVAVEAGLSVREFAILPGDEAYPAALAVADDGALYSGSYQTGALWQIDAEGKAHEILGSSQRIGSVSGLDWADGALYILDRITPLDAQGAVIWRYANGELESLARIPPGRAKGVMLPDDIAIDSAGGIYISDRDPPRALRLDADGGGMTVFWQPRTADSAPTGLAYDQANHALLVTDSANDRILRISIEAPYESETVFADANDSGYGMDGIAISPAGEIFVALLNWNRVARVENGELVMLARDFRGASDVAVDSARNRLYATNWNQFSLGFGTRPQLPFAIDVIEIGG